MKASDLDILLHEGEGSMLEYKESFSSSFARELVALANTAGGKILLGVRDDGTAKGIPDSNDVRARIQDTARNCDPPVKVLVERVGEVTVVTVRETTPSRFSAARGSPTPSWDWFNEGANVFVEIYSDRIEVSNPGGLPKGMLPSDLGRKSVRRNPLIADLLHRIDFIEKAVRGSVVCGKRPRSTAVQRPCSKPPRSLPRSSDRWPRGPRK